MSEYIERSTAVAISDYAADEHPYDRYAVRSKTSSEYNEGWNNACDYIRDKLEAAPAADVEPVRHGRVYTAHEVASLLAETIGDDCACNVNCNDEWLPEKCELTDECPTPVGVACWEQLLKWRDGGVV